MSEVLGRLKVAEDALADVRRLIEGDLQKVQTTPAAPPPQVVEQVAPTAQSAGNLKDPAAFFNALRTSKALGPSLSPDEVSGCEAIAAACAGFPASCAAYALATAVVETAGTMQPIKEYGGNAYFARRYDIAGERPDKARELGNLSPGDGALYCGRGYVQMTGKANYARAEEKLQTMGLLGPKESLVLTPDLALRPDLAAAIMRYGLAEGWFTGKGLDRYLSEVADIHQFTNARKTVNGTDRDVEIAGYALEFQSALRAGGWK